MFWFVCCNIGLFSVLLHQKEVFFQYAGSHPDFHSILLKQRFCFLLAKLRCLRIVFLRTEDSCLEEQPLPFFVHKLRCLPFILPKTCFGFLATTVEAASLSSQKTAIWLFVAKYAALTFIATRICFGLLATKLGFFEAYITKNSVVAFC